MESHSQDVMDKHALSVDGLTYEIEQIKRMIPHRYPMLMIDRVVGLVPDVKAVGIKNLTINEPFFQGHFPSEPLMPGVLIIECMAQTAAVLVVATLGPDREGSLVYFMSVDAVRFRKPVVPGNTLHIHVEKQRKRGNVWKFRGIAKVEQTVVAEATYAAMIRDQVQALP